MTSVLALHIRWMKSAFKYGTISQIWRDNIEVEKWFDPAFINDSITGTFHVQGPILIEPHSYRIKVQIVDIDDKTPPKPVIDEFELYEKIGFLIGL